jgi:hypothetical protein
MVYITTVPELKDKYAASYVVVYDCKKNPYHVYISYYILNTW